MTKIVHLTSVHPADDPRILDKQCHALARAGYEVVLIAPEPHGQGTVRDPEVRIRTVPRTGGPFAQKRSAARRVYLAALDEAADVYHIHDPELLPAARRLHRASRLVVYDMRENWPVGALGARWIPPGLRRVASLGRRLAQRRCLAGVPVVLAEDFLAQAFPWIARRVVVRDCPLVDEWTPVVPSVGTPLLGYVGPIDAAHGSVAMLEALSILQRFDHAPRLVCAGPVSTSHCRALSARIKRLGLLGVELRDCPASREAWRQIAGARVGLAVLQRRPDLVDSLPSGLYEYMALGIPVIASDFPRCRALIDEAGCGVCVDPARPEEIAGALAWLLDNPETARSMGQRGRRAVLERHDWNREATRLLAFYERLLRDAGRAVPWTTAVHPELEPFLPMFRGDRG